MRSNLSVALLCCAGVEVIGLTRASHYRSKSAYVHNHSTKSSASLNHIPALPLGATYSCPSGADPAATSAANNAKTTDFDGDMIQVLFLTIKRWRENDFKSQTRTDRRCKETRCSPLLYVNNDLLQSLLLHSRAPIGHHDCRFTIART